MSEPTMASDAGEPVIAKPFDPADEIEDQSDEVKELARNYGRIRTSNNRLLSRLERAGASLSVTEAQLEFYMSQLVKNGVLTHEQYWNMQMDWQMELRRQLQGVIETMRQQVERQKLVVPRGGLVVPPSRPTRPKSG